MSSDGGIQISSHVALSQARRMSPVLVCLTGTAVREDT